MFRKLSYIYFLILSFISSIAYAGGSNGSALFINEINSARSYGMGGITANLIDEQSALHNPGAMGLFFFDRTVSISFPNKTTLGPWFEHKLYLKTYSIGLGYSSYKYKERKFHYSTSIAYSEKEIDYGGVRLIGSPPLTSFGIDARERAQYLSIGFGLDYFIRIGFGYSHKKIKSELGYFRSGADISLEQSANTAYDFGIIFELPLSHVLKSFPLSFKNTKIELTPSLAVVQSNMGNQIFYFSEQPSSLPKTRRIGVGLNTMMIRNSEPILSLLLIYEYDKYLVGNRRLFYRFGLESSILESLFLRFGRFRDIKYYEIGGHVIDYNTYGFGLNLNKLIIKIFSNQKKQRHHSIIKKILHNFDLRFDWSKTNSTNTKYLKLNLSI